MQEIKVIQKTIKKREELKNVALKLREESPNATFLVSIDKGIPGSERNAVSLKTTLWKNLCVLQKYHDFEENEVYTFDVPDTPELIYVFEFE